MSLDLLVCKVVKPKDANNTYSVIHSWEYPTLKRIQKTGYVCVKEYRLEANCMNTKWHNKFEQTQSSQWDTQQKAEQREIELCEMRIIFPEQIERKIIRHLDKKFKDLPKKIRELVKKKEVDFFYICW